MASAYKFVVFHCNVLLLKGSHQKSHGKLGVEGKLQDKQKNSLTLEALGAFPTWQPEIQGGENGILREGDYSQTPAGGEVYSQTPWKAGQARKQV